MQTWAKRGLQTALVTGGLLMLGTGIASADEDVNPDRPATPLDGSVTAPVHLQNNAIGTPLGTQIVPNVHRDVTIRASDVTRAVPTGRLAPAADPVVNNAQQVVANLAAPTVDKVRSGAASVTGGARDQATPLVDRTKPVTDKLSRVPGGDRLSHLPSVADKVNVPALDARGQHLSGNSINADLVVPVDLSGNAIAILGAAATSNDSSQSYGTDHDVATNGDGGVISGNVVDLDWALPVQFTNNAVAVLGTACAAGDSSQEAWATGDIIASGEHSLLGGNVIAPQFATPVQGSGNAISALGLATASSTADTSGEAGGWILTSGADSVGGGNAVPVPVAVPVKANGNAIMAGGRSVAQAITTADAQSGATRPGMYGVPTYVETDGSPAVAAGNIVQPAASGPVLLCGNAGGAIGAADAFCETSTRSTAGGVSRTTGAGSIASGAIGAAPVALPVSGYGNAPIALGRATTNAINTNYSTAGGDSYTRGHDSVLSGTAANTAPAGPVDVFANPIAAVGQATTTAKNTTTTTAGGYTGSTGDNAVGGGNMGTVPVTMPGEVFGNAVAGVGGAESTVSEDKDVITGGGSSAVDDNGLASSNLVNAPVASAAQAFGNGAGVLACYRTTALAANEVAAGGPSKATGTAGVGSGNIAQAPISAPLQAFGTGVSGAATGTQTVINTIDSSAGGDATSDGSNALAGGNVVSAPAGGAGQVYGESVAALGRNNALVGSATNTVAGGDTSTSGQCGTASGNAVSPQAMPLVQSFAAAASGVGGLNSALATNKTDAQSGGDIDTNGDSGFISGNLVDVPAGAVAQPFGDAVAAVGSQSAAAGYGDTTGAVGGTSTTSGQGPASLSGLDATLPVGANAPVYDVPVEVLARAITESANTSNLQVGEGESQLNAPIQGGIAPTDVPSLRRGARSMSDDPTQGVFSGVLTGLPGLAGLLPQGGLATPAAVPQVLPVPAAGRSASVTPVDGSGVLGGIGSLDNVFGGQPAVPAMPDLGSLLSPLPAGPSGFGGGRAYPQTPLQAAPLFGGLGDPTPALPSMPDLTTILPVVPAAPLSADVPTVTSMGSGSRSAGSSLDSTRAALANLFTAHSIG
jgi:trimeric autotransporter adhesin